MPNTDLEAIDRALADWEREHTARVWEGHRKSRKRVAPSAQTRARRRASMIANERAKLTPDSPPLKRARLERGMTSAEAARLCGIGERTYARAENHPEQSSIYTLWKIARAFRLPIGDVERP